MLPYSLPASDISHCKCCKYCIFLLVRSDNITDLVEVSVNSGTGVIPTRQYLDWSRAACRLSGPSLVQHIPFAPFGCPSSGPTLCANKEQHRDIANVNLY